MRNALFPDLDEFLSLSRFSDGRIDYSHADKAPVLVCFVRCNGKILLLKRSEKVRTYQGKWNTVTGYLDELQSLRTKILKELHEELRIQEKDIVSLIFGKPYIFFDMSLQKTWIIHPALADLREVPSLVLDWEHTEYVWILPEELLHFDIVPRLEESLYRVLKKHKS